MEEGFRNSSSDPDSTFAMEDWNPLQLACANGNEEAIKQLIILGCDVNFQFKGNIIPRLTPLHICARYNQIDAAKLIMSKANVDMQDQWGFTALHYATINKNVDMVRYLISCGASANAISKNGTNAIEIAKSIGRGDIADFLASHANIESDPNTAIFKEWLHHLHASAYITPFLEAGYELAFIAKHGLTDSDLDCIGIPLTKLGLRKKLLALHDLEKFYQLNDKEEEDEDDEEEEESSEENNDSDEEDESLENNES